jgi:hypothetical protein
MNPLEMLDSFLLEVLKLEGPKLLAVFLIVLGYGLKFIPRFPNKYIPAVILLLGTALAPFLLAWPQPGELDPGLRYAGVAAWIQTLLAGFLVGALSWLLHTKFLRKYIDEKVNGNNGKPSAVTEPKPTTISGQ